MGYQLIKGEAQTSRPTDSSPASSTVSPMRPWRLLLRQAAEASQLRFRSGAPPARLTEKTLRWTSSQMPSGQGQKKRHLFWGWLGLKGNCLQKKKDKRASLDNWALLGKLLPTEMTPLRRRPLKTRVHICPTPGLSATSHLQPLLKRTEAKKLQALHR